MWRSRTTVFVVVFGLTCAVSLAGDAGPFAKLRLPNEWQKEFWAESGVAPLLDLDTKALADLVPVQSGLKNARCPKCDALEKDDPLTWSIAKPDKLICRRCGDVFPSETIPKKVDNKIPEEAVEVLPGKFHHYPYHAIESERQRFADERIYLAA